MRRFLTEEMEKELKHKWSVHKNNQYWYHYYNDVDKCPICQNYQKKLNGIQPPRIRRKLPQGNSNET